MRWFKIIYRWFLFYKNPAKFILFSLFVMQMLFQKRDTSNCFCNYVLHWIWDNKIWEKIQNIFIYFTAWVSIFRCLSSTYSSTWFEDFLVSLISESDATVVIMLLPAPSNHTCILGNTSSGIDVNWLF